LFNQESHLEQESIFEAQELSRSGKNQTPHTSSMQAEPERIHQSPDIFFRSVSGYGFQFLGKSGSGFGTMNGMMYIECM